MEAGPLPESRLRAIHHPIRLSTPATSQVGKADSIPASSLNVSKN